MLDSTGVRQLAYVVRIDAIEPIIGSDNCECARVGGWTVMVRKSTFAPGDLAIYFEIDSQVDMTRPEFAFLAKKHGKVRTQKYTFGGKNPGFYSQGLLMSAEDFGGEVYTDGDGTCYLHMDGISYREGDFLTEKLGVRYAVAEDNVRKARSVDVYKKMAQRLGKKANTPIFKWFYKREWGKRLLFMIYGNKKADGGIAWPSYICSRTDVERIQNMPYILKDKNLYVASEKVDGSSMTVTAERKLFGRIETLVCSRNVVFATGKEQCYYDTNIYLEAYEKYGLKDKITRILKDYNLPNVALQMEVYGAGIQKRDYSTNEHKIALFHIVSNKQKMPMDMVVEIAEKYDIPHVPIVCDEYVFPNTIEEVQAFVEGAPSKIDGKPREGIVFYDKATGQTYTKFVSPEYLTKYH